MITRIYSLIATNWIQRIRFCTELLRFIFCLLDHWNIRHISISDQCVIMTLKYLTMSYLRWIFTPCFQLKRPSITDFLNRVLRLLLLKRCVRPTRSWLWPEFWTITIYQVLCHQINPCSKSEYATTFLLQLWRLQYDHVGYWSPCRITWPKGLESQKKQQVELAIYHCPSCWNAQTLLKMCSLPTALLVSVLAGTE